jgi:hypothetical protein
MSAKTRFAEAVMNKLLFTATTLILVASLTWHRAHSRERDRANPAARPIPSVATNASDRPLSTPTGGPLRLSAVLDTFILAEFSFNPGGQPSMEGWETVDLSAQQDTFFHVADAGELDGGDYGGLVVLEGNQSLWCGAPASTEPGFCGYATLPGTGNNWNQFFTSVPFPRTGDVMISFLANWDTEPGQDLVYLLYRDKNDEWISILVDPPFADYYSAQGSGLQVFTIPGAALADSVQIRFKFISDGAWSDEDGLWNSDGAIIIDSLMISDALGIIDFQNFESEPAGALRTNDGHWSATTPETYGDFSGLFDGSMLVQDYPCFTNQSTVWGFFEGSSADYTCGGHPQQPAVPFGRVINSDDFAYTAYLRNEIRSPTIDLTRDINGSPVPPTASGIVLEFDVYRDLPFDNLVFYTARTRSVFAGCPERRWRSNSSLGYGDAKDWYRHRLELGPDLEPGADGVQIALGAYDACEFYCGSLGSGNCHSHAPLFDNVRVVRVDLRGPAWGIQPYELFQDNFSADGTTTGPVRIDTGHGKDSLCIYVAAFDVGLDTHIPGDPNSGPAVYCHVRDISLQKSGSAISGNPASWPVVSVGGGWTVLRFNYERFGSSGIKPDRYCVGLNDTLYVPGDTIEYYFSARDAQGNTNYWTQLMGVTPYESKARAMPSEMTCLPANALSGVTDILYIDDFDNGGAQPFFDSAFDILELRPDRYDVLGPSSIVGNGPGSKVQDVMQQIVSSYRTIIWNSGDLRRGLIGDGTVGMFQSDDFGLLFTFLDQSALGPGLYISGDNIAEEWVTLPGASAVDLRATYLNFELVDGDHRTFLQTVSPMVMGQPGSCFYHPPEDTLIAFGGCPLLNDFDVLFPAGSAQAAMAYEGNAARSAVIAQATPNAVGDTARVILSGFSYHRIRDDRAHVPMDRVEHLADILQWLQGELPTGVPRGVSFGNRLAQNHPNPFNPTTKIQYSIRERAHVTLVIFNVAGQLVRTLVDEGQTPRQGGYTIRWNGLDNNGESVASGVYFYRLRTGSFVETRKMVLLK